MARRLRIGSILVRSNAMLSRWFEKLEILFVAAAFAEAGEFDTAILIAERAR